MARATRPHMSVGTKLRACLFLLGFTQEEIDTPGAIQWDHNPALGLRTKVYEGGVTYYSPDANDWRYIVPMRTAGHKTKTIGTPATTAGSDIHRIRKIARVEKQQAEFRQRLLTKGQRKPPAKRKMRGRPFPKKGRR